MKEEYDHISWRFSDLETTLILERVKHLTQDDVKDHINKDEIINQLFNMMPFLTDNQSGNKKYTDEYSLYTSGVIDGWKEYIMYQDAHELFIRLFHRDIQRYISEDLTVAWSIFAAINSLPNSSYYHFIQRTNTSSAYQKGVERGKKFALDTWEKIDNEVSSIRTKYIPQDTTSIENLETITESDIRHRLEEAHSLRAIIIIQQIISRSHSIKSNPAKNTNEYDQ
jgi:hypothetical protein